MVGTVGPSALSDCFLSLFFAGLAAATGVIGVIVAVIGVIEVTGVGVAAEAESGTEKGGRMRSILGTTCMSQVYQPE